MKKTILKAAALFLLTGIPATFSAQKDLTIGFNYSYDPPSNCNNQLTNITVDICNNGSASAGSFLVGIYLYNPSNSKYWVLDQTTVNSLSGNSCITISNWNIDMNSYPSLPAPANNYRIGVWADTANVISETDENNNASLLSGNIQVCSTTSGFKNNTGTINSVSVYPNPANSEGKLLFTLSKEEKITAAIYDVTGKMVLSVFDGSLQPGSHIIPFKCESLEPGIYFTTIKTGRSTTTQKLIIQK